MVQINTKIKNTVKFQENILIRLAETTDFERESGVVSPMILITSYIELRLFPRSNLKQ